MCSLLFFALNGNVDTFSHGQRSRWWWTNKQQLPRRMQRHKEWWLTAGTLFKSCVHDVYEDLLWKAAAEETHPEKSFKECARQSSKCMYLPIMHRIRPAIQPSVCPAPPKTDRYHIGGGVVHCAIEWLLVESSHTEKSQLSRKGKFQFKFRFGKAPQFILLCWTSLSYGTMRPCWPDGKGQTTRHTRRPAYWVLPMMMHCTALADKKRMRRTSKPVAEIESIDRSILGHHHRRLPPRNKYIDGLIDGLAR